MYIPERTCAVCRKKQPKENMIRIVRTTDGRYIIDDSRTADGRGAYICADAKCVAQCIKKRTLDRAFKATLPEEIYESIAGKCQKD